MSVQRLRFAKMLLIAGIVVSALHFADNTVEIVKYPEPAWITPIGVALTWIPLSAIAFSALLREQADARFFWLASIYAVLLIGGLAHYVYGSPMHMAITSNATVLFEASTGVVLAFSLWIRRPKDASDSRR